MKKQARIGDNTFIYDGKQVIVHNHVVQETIVMDKKSFKELVMENMDATGGVQ